MEEGFLRQRRNLMVTCCLLCLLSASGVSVEKVGIAGFEMKFERPVALFAALWTAYAYYFYRYAVYFRASALQKLLDCYVKPFVGEMNSRVVVGARAKYGDQMEILQNLKWAQVWAQKLAVRVQYSGPPDPVSGKHARVEINHELDLSRRQRIIALLKMWSKLLWVETASTDYLFPFLFAAVTFWYAGFRNWQGSFLRIVASW